jgi:hypothetical protein
VRFSCAASFRIGFLPALPLVYEADAEKMIKKSAPLFTTELLYAPF